MEFCNLYFCECRQKIPRQFRRSHINGNPKFMASVFFCKTTLEGGVVPQRLSTVPGCCLNGLKVTRKLKLNEFASHSLMF